MAALAHYPLCRRLTDRQRAARHSPLLVVGALNEQDVATVVNDGCVAG